jgi:hypothetical protein
MHWLEGQAIDHHNMNRQGCIDENDMPSITSTPARQGRLEKNDMPSTTTTLTMPYPCFCDVTLLFLTHFAHFLMQHHVVGMLLLRCARSIQHGRKDTSKGPLHSHL